MSAAEESVLCAENTALKARVVELEAESFYRNEGLAASDAANAAAANREMERAEKAEARVVRLREVLTGLLSRPFAKPGWSPKWDALVAVARAALSEETP